MAAVKEWIRRLKFKIINMKKYNLELLKEQCGQDTKFFNEMIDIFIRSSLEGIEKLEEACAGHDLKQMSHYAHKIVSPCRHIDASGLIGLLREMEAKADSKELDPERAKFLTGQIKTELNDLITDLKTEYV
jgi:HPt (histidine-containing phosphotransfer) domain-containing protein